MTERTSHWARRTLAALGCTAILASPLPAAGKHSDHQGRSRPTASAEKLHAASTAHLEAALQALDAAGKAVESGDRKAALAHLAEARRLVSATQKALARTEVPPKHTFANAVCPIMGAPIDPDQVPDKRVRTFRGRRIAFCCAGCPAAWDKLSDKEKEAKLSVATPKTPSGGQSGPPAVVNDRCPMMGSHLGPKEVPANLIRHHKGQRVGFCCAACPAAWDKLSDEQRDARLEKVRKRE